MFYDSLVVDRITVLLIKNFIPVVKNLMDFNYIVIYSVEYRVI